jgi:hypothetical protein
VQNDLIIEISSRTSRFWSSFQAQS